MSNHSTSQQQKTRGREAARKRNGSRSGTAQRKSKVDQRPLEEHNGLRIKPQPRKRAGEETEERHRMLVELSPDAIAVHSEGKFVFINPAGARLLGAASADEIIGKKILDFVHPDYPEFIGSRRIEEDAKRPRLRESKILRLDRQAIDVEASATSIRYGAKPAVQLIIRDISERKRAEEALQKSHEKLERKLRERTDELTKAYELLKRIFASITVHIAYMDRDFNYISVNRAYAEAEGRTPDFFIGKNYFDLHGEENKAIFENVVRAGEAHIVYEKPFLSAKNPERGVTYWDWSLQPVKDIDKTVSGVLLSSVNVTDRKRAEENNIRLAAAIESAADAVAISDTRGIIKYVNPAFEKITGFSKKEALGRDLHILDGGQHDAAFYHDLRETIRRDGVWKGRLINKKKDGTVYSEECTYSPIRNPSGKIINYVSIKRDVTEKLWLESIAQSVDTMNNIGYVFAGVRHEIGNPVNSVNMILEVLKSKLPHLEKPAIEGYVNRALSQLSRVGYLLRTLKAYNMYEKPQLQSIAMNEFLEQFLSVAREDFKMKGITITVSIDPDTPSCYADPRALQQILLNFLANAADALEGRENPTVAITVYRKGGMVRIRVQDNGCGMTEEEQKALFKPFYTTKPKGTGLGLVIVKKMLTMMKGTIEITSRKNSGTSVDVAVLQAAQKESVEYVLSEKGSSA